MADTNQVRQILMNELGLTRVEIRAMTEEIVKETVKTHLNKINLEVFIEKCVRQEVDRLAAVSRYDRSAVRELIAKAAGRALEAKILSAALLPD